MCIYIKRRSYKKRGFAVVLTLMMILGSMVPLSVFATDENGEGSIISAVGAAEAVKTETPSLDEVEMEGADTESIQMLTDLEDKNGAVMFAAVNDTSMDVPAESSEQVVLNYTKIIRHEEWFTRSFTVQYDGKERVAYCIEPKDYPPDKGTHSAVKYDNDLMTKALYYSYGYPGYETTTKPYLAKCNLVDDYNGNDGAYVISHLVLSYFYDSESTGSDAFKGLSEGTKTVVKNMAAAIKNEWPDVPIDASLSFDMPYLYAEWNADRQYQETPVVTLKGHRDNRITVQVPAGVTMVKLSDNKLTEHTSDENGEVLQSVDVHGGDEFFFTAPETVTGIYNSDEMVGSLQEFQPYLIKVTAKQDILFCGDGDRDAVAFSIKWAEIGSFVLNKVSAAPEITEGNSSYSLKNAKYGLYNEGELYQEITTDEYGTAEVLLPYGTYELKELEAPLGYAIDQEVHEVSVDSEQTTFEHKEQIAPVEEKIVKTDYSPKTGDNNCMGLAVTVLVAASVMMVSVIKKKEV